MNDNKNVVNAEAEEKDANSVLNYIRKMVKFRKNKKDILVYGKYTLLDENNRDVYAYPREANGEKFLLLFNFRKNGVTFNFERIQLVEEWINNLQPLKVNGNLIKLQPYQACIIKLK